MYYCQNCKTPVEAADRIGRTDTCQHCNADLHCCLNCRFHNSGSHNACLESQAERVVDKEKSNFCDYFSFTERGAGDVEGFTAKNNPLDGLFKK